MSHLRDSHMWSGLGQRVYEKRTDLVHRTHIRLPLLLGNKRVAEHVVVVHGSVLTICARVTIDAAAHGMSLRTASAQ